MTCRLLGEQLGVGTAREHLDGEALQVEGIPLDEPGVARVLVNAGKLDAKAAEDANLWWVARAVVASALAREESRGGHFRRDIGRNALEGRISI